MSQPYKLEDKVLEIRNVSLRLSGKLIIRDINQTVYNITRPGTTTGQIIAILGPSGIGKTKLFEVIAGLLPPTTGEVLLNKEGTPVRRGQVGVVFQNYPLFEHRSVLGNLIVACMQKNRQEFWQRRFKSLKFWQRLNPLVPVVAFTRARSEAQASAVQLLQKFALAERAKFYPAQLSGGQRQRVAIAQQILCSEHFLLMDEPFSGLDPNMVEEVCAVIQGATNSDDLNTTICVTHDVTAAVSIADVIWLMGWQKDESGRFIEGATVIDTYDLMKRGLAWKEGIATTPECAELVREIKTRFKELKR